MKNLRNFFNKKSIHNSKQAYLMPMHNATWTDRNYQQFADEAYIKNVIAHRAISLISQGGASIKLKLMRKDRENKHHVVKSHPILQLLEHPNPTQSYSEFFEMLYSYKQISGNSYVLSIAASGIQPKELYCLRPDRISIIPGDNFLPKGYVYKVNNEEAEYRIDQITGYSDILHLKNFHPLSDWYGLSSIEAAAYSIDQHNQAGQWNQALLQNGARPSGAIVVKGENNSYGSLNDEQFGRIKDMIDQSFSGPSNAGKPILLEGGLEWQEMSISPKDMDFIESKHSSARDIALAFGVPPQLLGIPGDNTYSNLQEARLALWEQTIIPMAQDIAENLTGWLQMRFGKEYFLQCDTDQISALAYKREALWNRMENCSFLTINEKRAMVGLGPIKQD